MKKTILTLISTTALASGIFWSQSPTIKADSSGTVATNSNATNQQSSAQTVQSDVDSAQTAVDQAQSEYDQAQAAVNSTSAAVQNVQSQLTATSASSANTPTVTVNAAMQSATNDYLKILTNSNATSAQLSAAQQTWGQALDQGYALNSYADTDASDLATAADWTNLTTSQADELSWFAAEVINQAREQLGLVDYTGRVVVTTGAVAMAIDVANKYQNDRYTDLQHYYSGINAVASGYGLATTSGNSQYYENLAINVLWDSTGKYETTTTMADLKNQLYTAIMQMLFQDADSNYGHTVSLLGTLRYNNFVRDQTPTDQRITYLGVATDAIEADGNLYTRIHIIDITDASAYIKDQATFQAKGGETILTAPTTTTSLDASQSASLQTSLAQAQAAYQAALEQLDQAQTKLNQAQADLKAAQSQLSAADTTSSSTGSCSKSGTSNNSSSSTTIVKVIGPDGQVIGTWSLDDPNFPYRWALNNK